MAVNLYLNRCPQVGGRSHGFGSELVDDMTLCEDAHRRNELPEVHDDQTLR